MGGWSQKHSWDYEGQGLNALYLVWGTDRETGKLVYSGLFEKHEDAETQFKWMAVDQQLPEEFAYGKVVWLDVIDNDILDEYLFSIEHD